MAGGRITLQKQLRRKRRREVRTKQSSKNKTEGWMDG